MLKVFIWCLLKATHKDREQLVGLQRVALCPGQFVYGRRKAALELNLKQSTVQGYVLALKNAKIINIKSNNKFSVITVINWDLYQSQENESDSKPDSSPTTSRQQTDNKPTQTRRVKNVKNVKKDIYSDSISDFTSDSDLIRTVDDFIDMRKKIRKPLTERGLQLMLKRLAKLSTDKDTQIRILEQSIMNNWQGVFPLKEERTEERKTEIEEWVNS